MRPFALTLALCLAVLLCLGLTTVPGCQGFGDFQRGLLNRPPDTQPAPPGTPQKPPSAAYESGQAVGETLPAVLDWAVPGGLGAALSGVLVALRGRRKRKREVCEAEQRVGHAHRRNEDALTALADARTAAAGEIVRGVQAVLDGPVGRVKFTAPDGKQQTVADAAKQVLATQGPETKRLVDRVQAEMGDKT